MNTPDLLRDYAVFNCWANQRMADWLRGQPEALLTRPTPSSFPTLRETMQHIWDAQAVWLNRLRGQSPPAFLSEKFEGTTGEVIAQMLGSAQELCDFVQAQPDDYFDRTTAFTLFSGAQDVQSNSAILLHCLQHSTYHRGQMVTMARALGLTDPPKTDYIAYVRLKTA